MELEPAHASQTLTRTQKQTYIRINPTSPVREARLKRFVRQKTITPPKSQPEQTPETPVAAEQPSIDLPPIQAIPTSASPVVNSRRKRSSSQGNDARPAPAPKTAEPERTPNPVRTRVELTPIPPHSKSHSRENYSTQLKNSMRITDLKQTQQEQGSLTRQKEEPVRMELSKLFPTEKKRNKDSKLMSQSAVVDKNQEEVVGPVLPTIKLGIKPKDLVFGPNVRKDIMMKNYNSIVDGVRYSMHQVKPLPIFQIRSLQVSLKKRNEEMQKTLVLDLDETLIYASKEEPDSKKNLSCIDGGDNCYFGIQVRPYVHEFLQEMSREFEIIVFTAAEKVYAKNVLKLLDPERKYISHLLHRNHCLRTKRGVFIKDLRILLGRELKDMVIVDNFTPSFSFQLTNGIPIVTWNGDSKDQELKYLMPYLLEAKKYDDMRKYNKEKLRLEELGQL